MKFLNSEIARIKLKSLLKLELEFCLHFYMKYEPDNLPLVTDSCHRL